MNYSRKICTALMNQLLLCECIFNSLNNCSMKIESLAAMCVKSVEQNHISTLVCR